MSSKWPALALGRLDLANIIPSITGFFKDRKAKSRSSICDNIIIRMHYSWTFIAMLGAFVTVYYGWWTNEDEDGTKVDQIICASHFSATEMTEQENYVNLCLSYSYVEDKSRPTNRRYLLFYRWISWSLLFISILYYVPRLIASTLENEKVKNLLHSIDDDEKIGKGQFKKSIARAQQNNMNDRDEEKNVIEEDVNEKRIRDEVKFANEIIEGMNIREDKECSKLKTGKVKELLDDIAVVNKENVVETLATNSVEEAERANKILNVAKAADYIKRKGHTRLFWNYVAVHMTALGIDFAVIGFLDFLLQGRFLSLGFHTYAWRDPDTFTDYISTTFPPFASCEINEVKQLVAQRREKFGCHLTLMELYEKVFIFLWFWLAFVTIFTFVYIIGIFLRYFTPIYRKRIFYAKHPDYTKKKMRELMKAVYQDCNYADIFLLHQIRKVMNNIQMFELLMLLKDPTSLHLLDQYYETPMDTKSSYEDCSKYNTDANYSKPKYEDCPKYNMDANYNKPKQISE